MSKLLEAVRSKNSGGLTPEQEQFVSSVDLALTEALKDESKASEERNRKAMDDALKSVIGIMPKNGDGASTTIIDQLRSMAEKMDSIESRSTRKMSREERYQLRGMLEAQKPNIINAIKSSSPSSVEIAFNAMRAAAVMTTQNVVTGVNVNTSMPLEWDNEVAYLRYPQNFVLDIIRSRQVAKVPEAKIKRGQASREGQAVVVPEGTTKPLVSYTFSDELFKRKKIAAHMEWTEEFEMDFDSLFNSIIDLFETDLLRDWHSILLNEIISKASTYVSTTLDGTIPIPNIYTVIGAGILHIQNMEYQPDVIWMNQADIWAMNLSQDSTGQVIVPPIMVGSNQIAGLTLKVSGAIEPGKVLIGDSNTWKEEHSGYITRIGLINDQLITNEKTIVGEVFSLMYQATRDQGSWIYLDIPTVKAVLQKSASEKEGA